LKKERKNTPWNKTANTIAAMEGKEGAQLQLIGVANENLTIEEMAELNELAEAAGREESEKTTQIPMTHQEAQQILSEGGFTEEKLNEMSKSERKKEARRILEINGHGGRKSTAKELAKNNKFREILQDIFKREAKRITNENGGGDRKKTKRRRRR